MSYFCLEASGEFNACRVYRTLVAEDAPKHTALFETGAVKKLRAERSLVMQSAALRIEGRGRAVHIEILQPAGEHLLQQAIASMGSSRDSQISQVPEPVCTDSGYQFTFSDLDGSLEERERVLQPGPLDIVRMLSQQINSKASVPFPCIFSYHFVDSLEPELASTHHYEVPDFIFYIPESLIELLPFDQKIKIYTLDDPNGVQAQQLLNRCTKEALMHSAENSTERVSQSSSQHSELVFDQNVDVSETDERFGEKVQQIKDHIKKGKVYQAVLSRAFQVPCADPFGAYLRLRETNPSPYLFYLDIGRDILLGASPETCLKVEANRQASLYPLAGTRPRGYSPAGEIDPALDERLEAELRLSSKETSEHMMLVDLARNDLARVCKPGSRSVKRLLAVEHYSRVMHLGSTVEGTLGDSYDALHAYAATANMGTLVGAPKREAHRFIQTLETKPRGWYGGGVGFYRTDGALETAIIIRSAVVSDGVATIRAGAGIVEDSTPQAEANETTNKARAVLEAFGATLEVQYA